MQKKTLKIRVREVSAEDKMEPLQATKPNTRSRSNAKRKLEVSDVEGEENNEPTAQPTAVSNIQQTTVKKNNSNCETQVDPDINKKKKTN